MIGPIAFAVGFMLGAICSPAAVLAAMMFFDWRDGRRLRRGR